MNMNYSYPTTIYESILTQIYVFLVLFTVFFYFYHEQIISKIGNIYFSNRNLGKNTFIYCSGIIVIHVHACHKIANRIKPGSK